MVFLSYFCNMAKQNDWKKRDGVVYSTNNDFEFSYQQNEEQATLPPQQQNLRVQLDKSMRAGKQVTLVVGFAGTADDLEKLGKLLKSKCGVGGSVKNGEVIIQGDHRDKLVQILLKEGYKAKRGN
jgi:translation initiation factor 1